MNLFYGLGLGQGESIHAAFVLGPAEFAGRERHGLKIGAHSPIEHLHSVLQVLKVGEMVMLQCGSVLMACTKITSSGRRGSSAFALIFQKQRGAGASSTGVGTFRWPGRQGLPRLHRAGPPASLDERFQHIRPRLSVYHAGEEVVKAEFSGGLPETLGRIAQELETALGYLDRGRTQAA